MAEIPANASGRRCWLELIPGEGESVLLLTREHSTELDTDGYPGPGDVLAETREHFESLEAALAGLAQRDIDSDLFTEPWKTDFPF